MNDDDAEAMAIALYGEEAFRLALEVVRKFPISYDPEAAVAEAFSEKPKHTLH